MFLTPHPDRLVGDNLIVLPTQRHAALADQLQVSLLAVQYVARGYHGTRSRPLSMPEAQTMLTHATAGLSAALATLAAMDAETPGPAA